MSQVLNPGNSEPTRVHLKDAEDGSGDLILEFPQEMLTQLGWKEGDTLDLRPQQDGSIVLSRLPGGA